jgi:hypothetical protein
MRRLLTYLLLISFISYSCRNIIEEGRAEILINDIAMMDSILPFLPGSNNVITIRPDWKIISASELKCIVRKTVPDGSTVDLNETIIRGNNAEIALGPMTAPSIYEFRAGNVYMTGYGLEIILKKKWAFRKLFQISLNQGLSDIAKPVGAGGFRNIKAGKERFIEGNSRNVLYNPMYGVETAIGMRLHENVLQDQNDLRVLFRLNPGAMVDKLLCHFVITDPEGKLLLDQQIDTEQSAEWQSLPLHPEGWIDGDYTLALYPEINGKVWYEGPRIIYRRRDIDPAAINVSPLAPWTLQRDNSREEIVITDLHEAVKKWGDGKAAGWNFIKTETGTAIFNSPGVDAQPVTFDLQLTGTYAVFVQPHSDEGCVFQTGEDGLVRVIRGLAWPGHNSTQYYLSVYDSLPGTFENGMIFAEASDLSRKQLRLFGFSRKTEVSKSKSSGVEKLLLIPVTPESVEAFYNTTSEPATPLRGINDWTDYFHTGDGSVRLNPDQFETIIGAEAELGLNIDWSIGRSWVEYNSNLQDASRFPTVPYEQVLKILPLTIRYHPRVIMINNYDPLNEVLAKTEKFGKEVIPWLGMNRHYGTDAYEGMLSSKWFKENPQWWQWQKNASVSRNSAVSYFFPEVRKERTDILLEVADRGAEGLLIDACRQVPMLLYHPEMVAAFKQLTGIDPLKITAENREEYTRWITWRADFFTKVLRELTERLIPIEQKRGSRIIVAVRIPSSGLFWNLAQGLDVEQWLREGLVDRLQIDPLEERGGMEPRSHDITPYIDLGRRYNIPVIGGIGSTWAWGRCDGIVPSLHRAIGLIDAGVQGIEIYEANDHAVSQNIRWIIPLFGNKEKTIAFLKNSSIEAVFPVSASNAMYGYDNHSQWSTSGWNIYGMGGNGL